MTSRAGKTSVEISTTAGGFSAALDSGALTGDFVKGLGSFLGHPGFLLAPRGIDLTSDVTSSSPLK